ncbi:MAG: DNA-directed RNA polymerase subunit alpha [Treponemataceae bacterium]
MVRKNLLKGFKRPKGVEFNQEEATESYGKFIAYPFEVGFGTTIGNCLRRILLSSIQGYAVSAVRITTYNEDNVPSVISSEFENIPGVVEDTIEIINNIKQLDLKLINGEDSGTFMFEFQGKKTITGNDFTVDENLEIINKDMFVMELMADAHFEVEMQIDFGRGYVPAEVNEKYIDIMGSIPLDALYSPVEKVNYSIEPCRVGQRNDYDKLILEVYTDGTVAPDDVLAEAAKIAKEHFTIFLNFDESEFEIEEYDETEDFAMKKLLESPIKDLELTVRAKNCLDNAGIMTIGELVLRSEEEIANMRNVGTKSLNEIKEKLQERNLRLGMTEDSRFEDITKREEIDEA